MDIPFLPTSSSRLYAFVLKLRPLERGILRPFSGDLAHAALLEWMKSASPEIADWLHDGNQRRLFTCSSLQFPIPLHKLHNAERENRYLMIGPEKTYLLRITLLREELFPLFCDSLLHFNFEKANSRQPPFMQLGRQSFLLEEVISETNNSSSWVGSKSFSELVEQSTRQDLEAIKKVTMEFASLTTFNRIGTGAVKYGNYYASLPLPQYVFTGLARRWQEVAPGKLASIVQQEVVQRYIEEEGVIIENYNLKTHQISFATHTQSGFVGKCTYHLRGSDNLREVKSLSPRQQILLLATFAFYCGVGYKTTMGMGQVRLI